MKTSNIVFGLTAVPIGVFAQTRSLGLDYIAGLTLENTIYMEQG